MTKSIYLLLACLLSMQIGHSQSKLFMPRDFYNAYKNNTRAYNGTPGANYFQNSANYFIEVELDPSTRLISGTEKVEYFNNSPDTLRGIVVRFYQDFHKKGAIRNIACTPNDLHDGVDVTKISGNINGVENTLTLARTNSTLRFYRLQNPLPPNEMISLNIDWNFTMPKDFKMRYGVYDSTTYFVAYWFPQIGVFDDLTRWYFQPFVGSQEFYNDFCNFDVKIKTPQDFIVWATGELQNTEDLFTKKYLDRINLAKNSSDVVKIVTENDLGEQIVKQADYNIWHFKAQNVTDFAFACGDHCLWDATSIEKIDGSDEGVFISAVYRSGTIDFEDVADIAQKTIGIMSNDVLGVPFPFPSMTVFSGGESGMEFPMMVNDEEFDTYEGTVFVTSHEVSHSYFPFLVGTNEHQFAWMDEGLITLLPKEVEKQVAGVDAVVQVVSGFSQWAGKKYEVPLMSPSFSLSGYTYMFQAYSRSANAFLALKLLIGEDLFKKVLQEYISRWSYKHPSPYDFFYTVEDVVDEDLSWFWEPWFFEFGYPDLAIDNAVQSDNEISIMIKNEGFLPVNVFLTLTYEDNSIEIIEKSAKVWQNTKEVSINHFIDKKVADITLGNPYIPDSYPENNYFSFFARTN